MVTGNELRMQGIELQGYGGPERLVWKDDLPRPEPDVGQVRVRVMASALNPLDQATREGQLKAMSIRRQPLVPGNDAAGVIDRVGPGVEGWSEGEEVFGFFDAASRPAWHGFTACGTWAEYAVTRADTLVRKPSILSFEQAAALPVAGLTAWQGVSKARLSRGMSMLINGASGGVGSLAVQMAVHQGIRVTATASRKHHGHLKHLGADNVIDYAEIPVRHWPTEFDAVFDVANRLTWPEKRTLVRTGGRVIDNLVSVRGVCHRFTGGRTLSGVRHDYTFVRPEADELARLTTRVEQGDLEPVVDRIFPWQLVQQACHYQEQSSPFGKVVLTHC
ncbi:NADP-dependent oxidoreductase [Saccharospirillum salsuginis]|uniref:NADPH:quinone reductase n=1 Tax=Saccharospirillum salsuginis TaxID=418750 RepID=A0A918N6L8_9GAMM|nr:NADP-dependent oxidoreductase [Saccharospirillum salsuginis]GGX40193.1 NADPH:quinone reductase [Saccharospirillum salsuginis]